MREALCEEFEEEVHRDADNDRNDEEEQHVDQRDDPLGHAAHISSAQFDEFISPGGRLDLPRGEREDDDADDVVEHRGGDDRRADFAVQFAQFSQHGHGDADRRRRQDDAEEQPLLEFEPGDHERHPKPRRKRYDHSERGDQKGRGAVAFELFEIRLEPRRKHDHDHADLGERFEFLFVGHETGHADDDTGEQRAEHLRQPYLADEDVEQLTEQQNYRQMQKNRIVHILSPLISPTNDYMPRARICQTRTQKSAKKLPLRTILSIDVTLRGSRREVF